MTTLLDKYQTEVRPALAEALGMENPMQLPRVTKVIVNMGLGIVDKDELKSAVEELTTITGQQPIVTRARNSISNFKLREGMQIGAKVTLRGQRMYDFLDRLINATLPRIRDFRGIPVTAFDGHGNYTLGVKEQTIFPEIDPNRAGRNQGMDITIVTSCDNDDEARALLKGLGMPFSEK